MTLVPTSEPPQTEGMAVRWVMSNGKKNVTCWVRAAALERLAGNPDLQKADYFRVFLDHRQLLEGLASQIFQRGRLDGNDVIIRKENI